MTPEIKTGSSRTLRLEPPTRWTGSISVVVVDDQGVTLETPTATADPVETTVVSDPANSPSSVLVDDASGMAPGRVYLVDTPSWAARARVAAVDDDRVTFAEALPGTPEAGSSVLGVEIAVPLTSDSTTVAGLNRRVLVTHGQEEIVEVFHVVAHPWRFPVAAREVRDHIVSHWPSHPRAGDEVWIEGVLAEADAELRTRLVEAHRYAHRVWDRHTLRRAAWPAVYLELARRQLVPRGRDGDQYESSQRYELRDRVAGLLKSPTPYDENGDGKVSASETAFTATIDLTR